MNHTFSILFYIRKDKRVRSERAPIYLRITVNGKRAEQSIKRSIDTERWDSDLGYVIEITPIWFTHTLQCDYRRNDRNKLREFLF